MAMVYTWLTLTLTPLCGRRLLTVDRLRERLHTLVLESLAFVASTVGTHTPIHVWANRLGGHKYTSNRHHADMH